MSGKRYRAQTAKRAATCALGALLILGLSAAPAWAAPPANPAAPTLTGGNAQIVVTYTAPGNGGSAITGYTSTCISSDSGAPGTGGTPDGNAAPITVGGLTNGTHYTCTVTAINGDGQSTSPASASILVGLPSAPAAPTLVSGNGQIVVTFTPGAANSGPITTNNASCTTSAIGGANGSASGLSPLTVSGLTNADSYVCTVTSTNALGTGPVSPGTTIVAGLPDMPSAPSVTSGDSQIIVSFIQPSLNGSVLSTTQGPFSATCLSNGNPVAFGTGSTTTIVATSAADINGLTYTCHVDVFSQVGSSPDSPDSFPVIPAGIPGFPPAPTITPGNNVMHVAFVAPVNNGAAITSYTATCSSSDGGATGVASGPGSPITVTGLTNGNTYSCDVSATNSAGTGSISDESQPAVENATPAAPTQPTVVGGPSRVIVSFALPADNGNVIVKTTASCTSSNGGVPGTKVSQPTDIGQTFSPTAVTGLTNGKSYTCTVTATNSVGTSPASPASGAAIPRTAPGAPTGLKAVSGLATGAAGPVVVSFAAGAANGSSVTSFRVTCTDLKNLLTYSKTGIRSPLTLGGLTTGHQFSCVAVDSSLGGTSASSSAVKVTLGAPGQPAISRVVQKNKGITLTLLAPTGNGKPVTKYTAVCTSSNGGVARGSASAGIVIAVTKMSLGATYTCLVTADNARGAGASVRTGAFNITK